MVGLSELAGIEAPLPLAFTSKPTNPPPPGLTLVSLMLHRPFQLRGGVVSLMGGDRRGRANGMCIAGRNPVGVGDCSGDIPRVALLRRTTLG